MKVSRTVLRELKSRYLFVLQKSILLGCFLIATPVMAEVIDCFENANQSNPYDITYDQWVDDPNTNIVVFKDLTVNIYNEVTFNGATHHFENSLVNLKDENISEVIYANHNLSVSNSEIVFDAILSGGNNQFELQTDKLVYQSWQGLENPANTVFNLDLTKIQLDASKVAEGTVLENPISANVLEGVSFNPETRDVFVITDKYHYVMGITSNNQGIQLTSFKNNNLSELNFSNTQDMDVLIKTSINLTEDLNAHNLVLSDGVNLTMQLNNLTNYTSITAKKIIADENSKINVTFGDDFESGVYHIFKIENIALLPTVQFLDNKYNMLDLGNGSYSFMSGDVLALKTSYNLDNSQAVAAMALHENIGSNLRFQTAQKEIFQHLNSKNPVLMQKAKKALDNLGGNVQPIVQVAMTSHFKNIANVAENHMTSLLKGRSGGDDLEPIKMWMKGLYGYAKYDENNEFKTHEKGFAIGLTKQISQNVSLGLGYAYTHADVNQLMRDTDIDTNTGFAFVKYKPSYWFVDGIISYSRSKYEEEKSILSLKSTDNYHSDMYAFQTMAGYDNEFEKITFTPKVGMRYIHIEQNSYQDLLGTRIAENTYQYLTMLAGMDIETTCIKINDFCITPRAAVLLSYDLKSNNTQSVNTLNNGATYIVQGDSLERFATQIQLGLNAKLNNVLDFSLDYIGSYRHSYQEHGGTFKLLYHF